MLLSFSDIQAKKAEVARAEIEASEDHQDAIAALSDGDDRTERWWLCAKVKVVRQ